MSMGLGDIYQSDRFNYLTIKIYFFLISFIFPASISPQTTKYGYLAISLLTKSAPNL
jgi:hypothetical protein